MSDLRSLRELIVDTRMEHSVCCQYDEVDDVLLKLTAWCDAWDAALELDAQQDTAFWSPKEISERLLGLKP